MAARKPRPCPACPKYASCTALCDKVLAYARQDHVTCRETTQGQENTLDTIQANATLTLAEMQLPGASSLNLEIRKNRKKNRQANEILRLKFYEGMTAAQIGKRLKMKTRTVEQVLYRTQKTMEGKRKHIR